MIDDLQKVGNDEIMRLLIIALNLAEVNYFKQEYEQALSFLHEGLILLKEQYQRTDRNSAVIDTLEKQILNVKEKIVNSLSKWGDSQLKKKDFYSAIDCYKKVLYSDFNNGDGYFNLGKCLQGLRVYDSALILLKEAMRYSPRDYNIYGLMGEIYAIYKENAEKAIFYFQKYFECGGKDARMYNILGCLYGEVDKYGTIELQEECFKKAIDLDPEDPCILKNLALVYSVLGKNKQAIECYHKLFKMRRLMEDDFAYACLNIKLDNYEEGWKYFEHRFQKEKGPTVYPKIKKPQWKGQKLHNKTLLVQYEQGFGDSICFFRYLPQLKTFANKIIFRVQNELVDLLKANIEGVEIVGMSTPLENLSFDFHIPLMSLPYILNARIDNLPLTQGYLKADKDKVESYKKEFFDNDCFKIGISWQGSKIGNNFRDIPLNVFYPLSKLKKVQIYSFQKGFGSEQLEKLPQDIEIIELGSTFNDFNDTAAAMENVDLFVTSDNSVANLAGAMSKKTFLLLDKDAEWRWGLNENKNPWYDSFITFKKQNLKEDWSSLMQRVVDELSQQYL